MPSAAIFATVEAVRGLALTSGLAAATMVLGCGPARPAAVEEPEPRADRVVAPEPTEIAASAVAVETPAPALALPEPPPPPPPPPARAGAVMRERLAVHTAKQTLTGDRGEGYDDLYGTRNVRAVLNGVFYRGGANNAFHREGKRHNKNPLPADGLANLCHEGFGTAVYLYPTNFETAAHETTCKTPEGTDASLIYEQRTTQHGKKADLRFIFELILDSLRHPEKGGVYVHCWNGWHASGYIGAVALRQFCGFTGEQGVKYWNATAKGASKAEHDSTRDRIRKFKPFPEYTLTDEEKALLCPDPRSFKFADAP